MREALHLPRLGGSERSPTQSRAATGGQASDGATAAFDIQPLASAALIWMTGAFARGRPRRTPSIRVFLIL